MNRYATTPKKIDKSGIRVYSTTYYPQIPIENSDKFRWIKYEAGFNDDACMESNNLLISLLLIL